MPTPEPPPFAAALGRVPSGLFVLTAAHGGKETAMLASWVMQCSFDPPQIMVALKKDRPIAQWLMEHNARVVVNIVPEDGKKLIAHFGKGFAPDQPAFEGVNVDREAAAAPVLQDASAFLECEYETVTDIGDHLVFVLKVVGGRTLSDAKPYLHVRKNGLNY